LSRGVVFSTTLRREFGVFRVGQDGFVFAYSEGSKLSCGRDGRVGRD
jgi:hypothetical protein